MQWRHSGGVYDLLSNNSGAIHAADIFSYSLRSYSPVNQRERKPTAFL